MLNDCGFMVYNPVELIHLHLKKKKKACYSVFLHMSFTHLSGSRKYSHRF